MANPPRRPFRPGFPIWELENDPRVLRLPVAAYGMLYKLAVYFWRTECADLPIAESELRSIARAHKATWAEHKSTILLILADYCPRWRRSWLAKETQRSTLGAIGSRGMATQYARKAQAEEIGGKRLMTVTPKPVETPETPVKQGFRDK